MNRDVDTAVEELYRSDWGRILAALIRLVGDFEVAEEAVQEAFAAGVVQWRESGIPDYPRAWIIQTARHKAIDVIRRRARFHEKLNEYAATELNAIATPAYDVSEIPDDCLRLIFTCCHPALARDAQVGLTLRTLCGLETGEIARAFLVPESTMAQRLVRAKRKIRDARIPYVVPGKHEMDERLDSVLAVIYLVFNEGYAATRHDSFVRADLCEEAIRLARLVRGLLPRNLAAETAGLLALMLFHDARRHTRLDSAGEIVTLEYQDRSRWNQQQIAEALALVREAMESEAGPYSLQAAIVAQHCLAARADDTNWTEIVRLYDLLEELQPSPVVSLNRAVAIAMRDGPEAGLAIVEALSADGDLEGYHLLHSSRADLLRRARSFAEAAESYRLALREVTNESEKRYLQKRLAEVMVEVAEVAETGLRYNP